jgi:hypothetical protein
MEQDLAIIDIFYEIQEFIDNGTLKVTKSVNRKTVMGWVNSVARESIYDKKGKVIKKKLFKVKDLK